MVLSAKERERVAGTIWRVSKSGTGIYAVWKRGGGNIDAKG